MMFIDRYPLTLEQQSLIPRIQCLHLLRVTLCDHCLGLFRVDLEHDLELCEVLKVRSALEEEHVIHQLHVVEVIVTTQQHVDLWHLARQSPLVWDAHVGQSHNQVAPVLFLKQAIELPSALNVVYVVDLLCNQSGELVEKLLLRKAEEANLRRLLLKH